VLSFQKPEEFENLQTDFNLEELDHVDNKSTQSQDEKSEELFELPNVENSKRKVSDSSDRDITPQKIKK
jgi:hypothetical protein